MIFHDMMKFLDELRYVWSCDEWYACVHICDGIVITLSWSDQITTT